MTEFRWHLMADETPLRGECDYLVMRHDGGLQLAEGYACSEMWSYEYFYYTAEDTLDRKLIEAKDVHAWAEIPPLEVDDA